MSLAQKGRRVVMAGLLLLGGVYVRALAFTPVERFQGPAQKIFYLHVPAAVTTELAVILVGLAGVFFRSEERRVGKGGRCWRGRGRERERRGYKRRRRRRRTQKRARCRT